MGKKYMEEKRFFLLILINENWFKKKVGMM